jgi:UDP:flavonoid glycosyltransferase YjiC (YdhE family)
MRIVLLTYGSRGDVEPFVALGKGLQCAGHNVRLAAPALFEGLASSHSIEYIPLPGDPDRLVQDLVQQAGTRPWRMVSVMSRYVLPLAERVAEAVREACQGADVIVHSFLMTQAGHEAARELGVSEVSAQFFPVFSGTGEFPAVTFPDLPLGSTYRRLTHAITIQTFRQGGRLLYGRVRRRAPHLPPLSRWPFAAAPGQRPPILYAFSSQVVPPPADWAGDAHVTGYWFLDPPDGWEPPPGLLDFLDAGSPPVYIGFGSITAHDGGKLTHAALDALALSRQRGVLGMGTQGPRDRDLPANVYAIGSAPHSWLFPRMAAVVHHGGAGTTGAGLRAGVPNVIVPFTSDQPFWSRQVFRLGVGPRPIPARRLSATALARAISAAVEDSEMRIRAQSLGERIRAEDGVARAIEVICASRRGSRVEER